MATISSNSCWFSCWNQHLVLITHQIRKFGLLYFKNYFGKGLFVELNAKDYGSGLENIYYTFSSNGFKEYSSNLQMDNEGEIDLFYYSSDNVGNSEKIRNKKFTVDLTPPSTEHSIIGIVYQGNNTVSYNFF